MRYYVFFVEDDVEPSLIGPFDFQDDRDSKAIELKNEYDDEHGILTLDIDERGVPSVGSYSGGFFEGALEEE